MAKDDAFKSSFINRKADLEIDKLFRACVKLKASDLHLKVDKPPMVRVERHAAADEPRADLRRGNGSPLLSADERAEPQDFRKRRRRRLRPHAAGRGHRGGFASICCSSLVTSDWWLAA